MDVLVAAVEQGIDSDAPDRRPAHGDLYEAQVLVTDDARLGLIDLDDVGLGDPLLDAATFSAHLLALALSGTAAHRILGYRAALRSAFLTHLDATEAALRWREAYALLLLTPSPFRTQHPTWPTKITTHAEAASQLLQSS